MEDRIKKHLIAIALLVVLPQSLMAQPLWTDVSVANKSAADTTALSVQAKAPNSNPHINSRRVSVDYNQLKSTLAAANVLSTGQAQKALTTPQIDLPMPYGGLQTFNVVESSVMETELAAKYPQIKIYKVTSINDSTITGVLDTGGKGFHAYLFTAEGEVFIDPVSASTQQEYYSYYKRDYASIAPREFSCGVKSQVVTESPVTELKNVGFVTAARTGLNEFISYRLAVATTGEYSNSPAVKSPGSNTELEIKTDALSAVTTAIARVNLVYERDLAVRLVLVEDNDLIIFTDAGNDPYSAPNNAPLLIDDNQAALDSILGSSAYDVGHVLTIDGGGLAGLGVACLTGQKARAESGHPNPVGDPFYIDILAHEIGHQLGANHSFNGTTDSCGGVNRNRETAYEPGGGTTIMAYAGICGAENISIFSDATFHAGSIAEIIDYTRAGTGNICSGSAGGSVAPIVDAVQNRTIPGGTAFTLTGSATDTEALTYQWDQMDAGASTSASTLGTDNGSNALFRSFVPVATPERTLPQRLTLFGINPDALASKAETLPTTNRTLHFRFTARDGNGGVNETDMQIVVDSSAGPFKVLQPNTSVTLDSSQLQTILWDAAGTVEAPVNCANVDVLYSTDNGLSFTPLISSSPNDGEAEIDFSNSVASNARIKVACSDNIFFDISDVNFRLSNGSGIVLLPPAPPPPPATGGGGGGGLLSYPWLFMLLITPLLRLSRKI